MIEFDATIFVQMINFFIFLFIMKAILFNPIIKSIQDRRGYLAEKDKEIKEKLQKLEEAEKSYHEQLSQARKDAQDLIGKNVALAEEEKQKIIKQTVEETKKQFEFFRKELEQEAQDAKVKLKLDVDSLAESISGKILSDISGKSIV